jgi:hypothetical protein
MAGDPLDGDALVLTAAKASVSGERLPDLVDRAQGVLAARLPAYGRRYECAHEDESAAVFFVEEGHWADLGEELGLGEREWKALERAHEEHLKRLGRDLGRRKEFETALELREAVVVGKE